MPDEIGSQGYQPTPDEAGSQLDAAPEGGTTAVEEPRVYGTDKPRRETIRATVTL
jgi:hypothetical protein